MKRRERQQLDRDARDDERLAEAALLELQRAANGERRSRRRRVRAAAQLMRLAAETREMLALWTYYRMACLDALDGSHLGAA
jgi:hypothetical protein